MTASPEARLYAAGFTCQLEFWLSPDGHRVLNLGDAIAALLGETGLGGALSPEREPRVVGAKAVLR